MRHVACVAVLLFVCPIALAQHHVGHGVALAAGADSPCRVLAPAVDRKDMPKVNWPVTTNTEAQNFFNQGMTEYYGFNYEEAMRNFRKAQELDPSMAMAAWGIALAAGPNINLGMESDCRTVALEQSALAVRLGQKDPDNVHKALINALALRYAGSLTETVAYSVAMREAWRSAQSKFQPAPARAANTANVGALYAESLLEMRPWGLYDAAYRPALDTEAINGVLITAMAAESNAIGANHFYIHTIEASATPRCGLESANLLQTWPQMTGAQPLQEPGHLVHMPSHIYFRLGDYARAIAGNSAAVAADKSQYEDACSATPKTPNTCPRLYYGHYLSHNLFFRTVAATFTGQSTQALSWARETCAHAQRFVTSEPGLQHYMAAPVMTLVMNRDFTTILKKEGARSDDCSIEAFPDDHILAAMWHWARGIANTAAKDLTGASQEYNLMLDEMALVQLSGPAGWGNNSAAAMLAVAQSTLQAHFTWAGGQCATGKSGPCQAIKCTSFERCLQAGEQAIEHLKLAVTHEDALVYDEPPQWFPPTREALGGAYLRVAQVRSDSDQQAMYNLAEKAFDEELLRHPGSGRALYGKMRAIAGRGEDSAKAKDAFCNAWGEADYTMSEEQLWPAGNDLGDLENYPVTCPQKPIVPPDPGPRPLDCTGKLPPPPSPAKRN